MSHLEPKLDQAYVLVSDQAAVAGVSPLLGKSARALILIRVEADPARP
jgi:hypothetical protein